ncbi:MAG: hypothetical protein JXR94_13235 [Candidatus Hydrogenedentes bacterium]|nr:hypothetical protein [Candidatus Hydrogenedentota bacterium]
MGAHTKSNQDRRGAAVARVNWRAVPGAVVLLLMAASVAAQVAPGAAPLDARIESFSADKVHICEFAAAVSRATGVRTGLVCAVPDRDLPISDGAYPADYQGRLLTLERTEVSARELLDEMTAQLPDYAWVEVAPDYVDVLPVDMIGNSEAFINHRVESYSIADTTPWGAVLELMHLAREAGHEIKFDNLDQETFRAKKPVEIALEDATFLEVARATFEAIGGNVYWEITGKTIGTGRIRRHAITTVELAAARAYLGDAARTQSTALSLYRAALDSAPYPSLKGEVATEMAEVYLGKGFPDVEPRYAEAFALYKPLMERRGAWLPDGPIAMIARFAQCAVRTGRESEAAPILEGLLADRAYGRFGAEAVVRAYVVLHAIPKDPEATIAVLHELKPRFPDNPEYQAHIDVIIARYQQTAERIQRLESIDVEAAVEKYLESGDGSSE